MKKLLVFALFVFSISIAQSQEVLIKDAGSHLAALQSGIEYSPTAFSFAHNMRREHWLSPRFNGNNPNELNKLTLTSYVLTDYDTRFDSDGQDLDFIIHTYHMTDLDKDAKNNYRSIQTIKGKWLEFAVGKDWVGGLDDNPNDFVIMLPISVANYKKLNKNLRVLLVCNQIQSNSVLSYINPVEILIYNYETGEVYTIWEKKALI
jgi:hypothetical protein